MKNNKLFFCLIIISVLLFTSSCSKSQQTDQRNSDTDELCNYEVTEEPFESMEIVNSYADYITYDSEAELYEASEMVFIGMPTETFTDGEELLYNFNAEIIPDNSDDKIAYCFTVRNVKVLKMLKGDDSIKEIKVAEEAMKQTDLNGIVRIIGLPDNTCITKKNVKYIYYVKKAAQPSMDFYLTRMDQGIVNIDGLDANSRSVVSEQRLNEVKTRFSTDFAKYDRSDELTAK